MARNHISPEVTHPHLVLLTIKNEQSLIGFCEKLKDKGIVFKPFYEADMEGQLTAIATEPIHGPSRKAFSKLKLLKE